MRRASSASSISSSPLKTDPPWQERISFASPRMTTINTARPVTRPVAAWRDQLPTLIRVYGIILTLVLLVAVVGIGNPAFLSAQNIFNMLSQWAPAGNHGGRHDIRHPDRRL